MSFVPVPNYNPSFLKDSTLILPTVSIGNVPQLVSDLLIHTFKLERIGFLDSDALVPVSGVREDNSQTGVTVPLEVFQSKDHQWTCIQQRSPALKGKRQAFIDEITEFSAQFRKVILLTSMDASRRMDNQINGPPFRTWGKGEEAENAARIGVPQLELEESDKLDLPGSGLASALYKSISGRVEATTMVIMFALEGDNVQDSIEYGNFVNTLLRINTELKGWTPPKSWEFLFGTPFNAELYQ